MAWCSRPLPLPRLLQLGAGLWLLSSAGPATALPVRCQGPDAQGPGQTCTLSAGAAQLRGEPGQLITLRFSDGQAIQAFCQSSRSSQARCLVRQHSAGDPSPGWLEGTLQLSDPQPAQPEANVYATVLIQQQPAGQAAQPLGRFELPWPLLLQALSLTSQPAP